MAVKKYSLAILTTFFIINLSSCNAEKNIKSEATQKLVQSTASQFLSADDNRLTYVGRFHQASADGITEMRSTWPGTLIRFQAKLQALSVKIRETGEHHNRYKILIDGELHSEISPSPAQLIYPILNNFDNSKSHEFTIYKITEFPEDSGAFQGIYLDTKAMVTKARPRKRVIEFIGDSYTVGYGNLSASRDNCDPWATTDNHLSYARQLGDHFDADTFINARSGIGIVQNYGDTKPNPAFAMPVMYRRTLQHQLAPEWDFSTLKPDLVIIAIGTNDHWNAKHEPSQELFQASYQQFLSTLYQRYPEDTHYLLLADTTKKLQARVKEIAAQEIRNGHKYISYSKQYHTNANGCNWHPDKRSHEEASKQLSKDIAQFMAWD